MADEAAPAPAAEGEAPQVSDEGGVTSAEDFQPRKLVLYKHWVRPKFLQYRYMYDYRQNYYDDVLEYLDKRQKGIESELPRPQYWAERVIRTERKRARGETEALFQSSSYDREAARKREQRRLLATTTLTNQLNSHNYHSRAYISQKYTSLL
jgi:hypothetical protein